MCILCSTYGTEPIADDFELEEILKVVAKFMKKMKDHTHLMQFVDAITSEGKDVEEDPEIVGDWERVIKDGRLTRDE